jgi:hypothetical protein
MSSSDAIENDSFIATSFGAVSTVGARSLEQRIATVGGIRRRIGGN